MVIQVVKRLNKGRSKFEGTNTRGFEHVWYIPSDLQNKRYVLNTQTVCDTIKEKFRYIASEIPWNFKIKGW